MQETNKTKEQLVEELAQARERIRELQAAEMELHKVSRALRNSETQFRKITEKSIVGVYLVQDDLFRYVNPKMAEIFGFGVEDLTDRLGPEDVVDDEDWPTVRDNLKRRIVGELDSINYSFKGRKSGGEPIHIEVYGSRMEYRGRPAVIGTILDITQRISAERDLEVQLNRFQTLHHLATVMTAERSLEENLGLLVGKSRELLDAEAAFIAVRGEGKLRLRVGASSGLTREETDSWNRFFESLTKDAKPASEPVGFLQNRLERPVTSVEIALPADRLKPSMMAPVGMKETDLGILLVCNKSDKLYSSSEQDLLCLLGNMAAMEIQRKGMENALAQSEEQLRLLSRRLLDAQEQERKRVARELHDGIGQSITAMKFLVENAVKEASKTIPTENLPALNCLVPMIQEIVEEVSRIAMDLRPSILDDLGILATVNWLCKEFQKTLPDISVEKTLRVEETCVPEEQKTVIFRILQEALNNVAKHSRASMVRISLDKQNGWTVLTIEDNGVGFDWESIHSADGARRGLGLAGMKERTQLSRGVFFVQSRLGAGTSITASWPG